MEGDYRGSRRHLNDNIRSSYAQQRQRSSRLANEHEERIRRKYERAEANLHSIQNKSHDRRVPTPRSFERNDWERSQRSFDEENDWDRRQQLDAADEMDEDMPAHDRFNRRPSEDGDGVSIASASTTSTISTHFTRL